MIRWNSIQLAVAFKRDIFSQDLVCLGLELQPQGTVELNESMIGWSELLKALPDYLPGALPVDEWLPRVILPPFELSRMEIYRRA
jgi:hypothetical protein